MLWDRGNYHVYGEEPLKALREGRLHLVLDGEKAKGEWALCDPRTDGGKPQWLLLKMGGRKAPSKKADDQSVKTGRTMAQIAAERDAEWQSNRDDKIQPKSKLKARIKAPPKKKEGYALREDTTDRAGGKK